MRGVGGIVAVVVGGVVGVAAKCRGPCVFWWLMYVLVADRLNRD